MFKNVYLIIIGVFAMMLVGFLNVSDSTTITYITSDNLTEVLVTDGSVCDGVTWTRDNNTITLNGTSTQHTYMSLLDTNICLSGIIMPSNGATINLPTNDYVLSVNYISGTITGSISFGMNDGAVALVPMLVTTTNREETDNFLVNDYVSHSDILIGTVFTNYTFHIMFETGDTASDYEPAGEIEIITVINGTSDYIQTIISASPYLLGLIIVTSVATILLKKNGNE